jgi:hemolysin D
MGIGIRLEAARDLLNRYGAAFRHAWQHRKELDTPARMSHESQFLPAALALQETPVSPAPRVAMWLLIVFSVFALLWAIFGRLDVVATAQGKTVPNDRVKTIQPLETAVVKQIYVTDGQAVKAGDVLLELDATATSADTVRLENDLTVAKLQAARAEAFLDVMEGGKPALKDVDGIPPHRLQEEQRLLDGQWHDFKAKLDRIEADILSKEAELRSTQEVVKRIEITLPILDRRAEAFKGLYETEAVSEQQYREAEKALLDLQGEWAATLQKLQSIQALHKEALKQKESLIAETRRTMLDSRHEAMQKVTTNSQELIKAQQRHKLMKLIAPVDGCVQQLAVHTVGGVVTPAQPLMVIVPTDDPLEVEAFLENKDIGFVNAGQEAEVKIETFPYTKYGTIHGIVKQVSSDAIQDEKRGLIYSSRVKLEKTTVPVGDKIVNLTAGMAVTVEIKTDKRRVIEYFLTPLLQHSSESLRER